MNARRDAEESLQRSYKNRKEVDESLSDKPNGSDNFETIRKQSSIET